MVTFPHLPFEEFSLTLDFEIGTDVVIISLNIALSLSSSKDENRLRTPLASVVVVCISQGRFLSTSRNLSTFS